MNLSELRAYFADENAEADLAVAFAIASNKFWCVEENGYDYKEGHPKHKMACAITDEHGNLMDAYLYILEPT